MIMMMHAHDIVWNSFILRNTMARTVVRSIAESQLYREEPVDEVRLVIAVVDVEDIHGLWNFLHMNSILDI